MKPKIEISATLKHKLETLKEGKSFTVQVIGEPVGTYSNRVYKFLHRTGLKPHFRIHQEKGDSLCIKRLSKLGEQFAVSIEDAPTKIETFVLDRLIDVEKREEALEIINQAIESNELLESDTVSVLEEWDRLQGREHISGKMPGDSGDDSSSYF